MQIKAVELAPYLAITKCFERLKPLQLRQVAVQLARIETHEPEENCRAMRLFFRPKEDYMRAIPSVCQHWLIAVPIADGSDTRMCACELES